MADDNDDKPIDIRELAKDYVSNKIFGTWNMSKHDAESALISSVFMPLFFMKQEDIDNLKTRDVAHFYEYISRAGPRSVNGYPMFFSMRYLTTSEFKQFVDIVHAMQEALERAGTPLDNTKVEQVMSAFREQWSAVEQLRDALKNAERMLGNIIRMEREKRSWSTRDLAEKCGVRPEEITEMECGARIVTADVAGIMRRIFL